MRHVKRPAHEVGHTGSPVPSAAEFLRSLPRATPIYLWLHAHGCMPMAVRLWLYTCGEVWSGDGLGTSSGRASQSLEIAMDGIVSLKFIW